MGEESQSNPTLDGPLEVLNIHIYRPGWISMLEIGLLILVLIPLMIIGSTVFYPGFDVGDALGLIIGLEVFIGVLVAVLTFVAYVGDAIIGRHAKKRRDILTLLGPRSFAEKFELRVNLLASKRSRKIPLEARDATLDCPPLAVFLSSREQQSWPMPRPSDIPFEPIPLGRDPHRTALLLNEFVGLPIGGKPPCRGPLKRTRTWHRNLPATTQKLIGLTPALLFFTFFGLTGRMSTWVILVPVILLGSFLAVYFRTEVSAPSGWLFPGLIATKKRGETRVLRRGHGTLWYDALEKVLWIPAEDGLFVKLKCEPQDGLMSIWAWLNTADPPEHIQLDDIA